MNVSVVIVTYNSQDCIAACVASVLTQTGVTFEIIVVDNASADGTLARLKTLDVKTIASPENLGFGRGCNLGFAQATGRYVYLLNPDAYLVGNSSLADLCQAMDDHSAWGMAGTMVCDADGKIESEPQVQYPGQRHVSRDFSKLPGRIAWVIGASMFVRSDIYRELGGFDPDFFLYGEETDFCLRLRELGYEIGYVPEVTLRHIGGASSHGVDPYVVSVRKQKGILNFRRKHYAPEDVDYLTRRDLNRARFRALANSLLGLLQPAHSRAWEKSRRYRGIWETSRAFLSRTDRTP